MNYTPWPLLALGSFCLTHTHARAHVHTHICTRTHTHTMVEGHCSVRGMQNVSVLSFFSNICTSASNTIALNHPVDHSFLSSVTFKSNKCKSTDRCLAHSLWDYTSLEVWRMMSALGDLKCTCIHTQWYNEKKVQAAQCRSVLPDHWPIPYTAPFPQRSPSFRSTSVSQTWEGALGQYLGQSKLSFCVHVCAQAWMCVRHTTVINCMKSISHSLDLR